MALSKNPNLLELAQAVRALEQGGGGGPSPGGGAVDISDDFIVNPDYVQENNEMLIMRHKLITKDGRFVKFDIAFRVLDHSVMDNSPPIGTFSTPANFPEIIDDNEINYQFHGHVSSTSFQDNAWVFMEIDASTGELVTLYRRVIDQWAHDVIGNLDGGENLVRLTGMYLSQG